MLAGVRTCLFLLTRPLCAAYWRHEYPEYDPPSSATRGQDYRLGKKMAVALVRDVILPQQPEGRWTELFTSSAKKDDLAGGRGRGALLLLLIHTAGPDSLLQAIYWARLCEGSSSSST